MVLLRITGEALSTALLSWLEEHECVEDKAMMVLRVCLPVVLVFRQEFAKFAPSPCTLTVKVIVKFLTLETPILELPSFSQIVSVFY